MLQRSSSSPPSLLLPALAVVASVMALGLGTSLAKQLFPIIGAQGTSALRLGFSALILVAIWRPWRWRLNSTDAWNLVRYGIALGLMNLLFYMSIRTIPFGIAVAIEFTGPLGVALLYSRQRLNYLWIALAALGLALLLPMPAQAAALDPIGVAYALAAAVCWAIYIIFGKRAGHLHAGHSVSLGVVVAAMIVVPVGWAHAGTALLEPQILLIGLAVALISSSIPISLEMWALKHLPRETFGIMLSLEPAVAALVAMVALQEHLSLLQWLAILCIMAASAGCVASVPKRGRTTPTKPTLQSTTT